MKKLLVMLLIAPFFYVINAQTAFDQASNYTSGTWVNGSNLGTGFGSWVISSSQGSGFAGSFIGDPLVAGINGMNASAFGLYSNPSSSGATVSAKRLFNSDLQVGYKFSFLYGTNLDAGSDGVKRFTIFSGETQLLSLIQTNSSTIRIQDHINTSTQDLFAQNGTNAMRINIARINGTQIRVYAYGRNGVEFFDRTFNISIAPNAFEFYAHQLQSGDQRQPYFDELRISEYSPLPASFPVINGDLSDAAYTTLATFTSGRDGFGPNNRLGVIKYFTDGEDIYLGITGELNSNNNLVLFFNFSGYSGRAASSVLSGSGGNGVFGNIRNVKLDMEADFAFALNEGNGSTNFYTDYARFGTDGYLASAYIGQTADQTGTAVALNFTGLTGKGVYVVAYNNNFTGDSNKGIELRLPISLFPGVTNAQTLSLFAVIIAADGTVSNVCIPGDPGAANLGNLADFSGIAGQDFFTSPASPLPVELSSFSAALSGKSVVLNWRTETEVNNYGFDVERSSDKNSWNTIGFVHGNGNSNSPKQYSFADNSVSGAGKYFYRLKQMDNDGTTEYSKVLEIAFDQPMEYALGQNYPNPFNPTTAITFSVPEAGFVNLSVFDLLGQKVAELVNSTINAGTYTMDFDATNLQSGIYFYTMKAGSFTETRKMMLTK